MGKYKFLAIVYLVAVGGSAVASLMGLNIQNIYRVPFSSFRWIDISILTVIGIYFYNLKNNTSILRRNGFVISLCLLYLVYETLQLLRTWGINDPGWQISGFLCTLNFFILLDLLTFRLDMAKVISFLRNFALMGAVTLIISNLITLYSFMTGNIVIIDSDVRVGLEVAGQKETVYTPVLVAFVYAFGLYFLQHPCKPWEKLVFLMAILSICLTLVLSFARGDLFTVAAITVIYIVVFSRQVIQTVTKLASFALLLVVFYLLFGGILREKGYDPVEKIMATVEFTMDVNNPDWEKGRSVPREYALASWKENPWSGVGYDVLYHHGSPEDVGSAHNFVITSLFHRGILGTGIYLLILFILFGNAVKLWFLLRQEESYENDLLKLLIIASFFWLVPFWNQEVIWEKYSLSIQFMYLGFITNIYRQKKEAFANAS